MKLKNLALATVLLGGVLLSATTLDAHEGNIHKKQSKRTKQNKYAGWYMRTRVSAVTADGTVYEHNTAGVFGELVDSKKRKDRHDISAFGPATLQVVFPHYDWGEDESGDYWSDYRKYNKFRAKEREVWTFQIKNQKDVNLANADIKIALDDAKILHYNKKNGNIEYVETGVDTEMKNRFTLVDVDNNETYSIDELENAGLTMEGKHTRTFRWVKGKVKSKDYKPLELPE